NLMRASAPLTAAPLPPPPDKNFDDDESVDGGRSSSRGASLAKSAGQNRDRRPSGPAGAVDEEDFIQAFEDVPAVQIYSSREVEEAMTKIRDVLSDDKKDWELRVAAVSRNRNLRLPSNLHLSSVLGSRFDHAAEAVLPTLLSLVPNSAKVMATSGVAAIRLVLRHTHCPRLVPIIGGGCASKAVAVRRRCFEFLDLLLQEWQASSLERHVAVVTETIKKGIHDADAEARSVARKCYWSFHGHFSREAELLFQGLESAYQKALQAHLRSGDTLMSLPASDRSSSSSQESLKAPAASKSKAAAATRRPANAAASSPGSLQRSRSDVDVSAAASARTRMPAVSPAGAPFSSASALPPGSYASLGKNRTGPLWVLDTLSIKPSAYF
uniref:CLASP N-terminal domain-containing protein n=1 Tax=Fundulus heteroclitus TaxID=8078 RepID=A0A3Q2PMS5_FUNHE